MTKRKERDDWLGWMALSGSTLVGLGLGMFFEQAGAGVILGAGVGLMLLFFASGRK